MLTLALDTAHAQASFALFNGADCLGEERLDTSFQQSLSSLLAPRLKDFFQEKEMSIQSIDQLVINRGPGSFTGLRSGMAFMQGLALAGDLPLYSMTHFEVLSYARGAKKTDPGKTVYLLDTKCKSFYAGFVQDGAWKTQIVERNQLGAFLSPFSCVVSDLTKPDELEGAVKCAWEQHVSSARDVFGAFWNTHDKEALLKEGLFYLKAAL